MHTDLLLLYWYVVETNVVKGVNILWLSLFILHVGITHVKVGDSLKDINIAAPIYLLTFKILYLTTRQDLLQTL